MVKIQPLEAPERVRPTLLYSYLEEYMSRIIFEEYFNGDWRKGHEFHKIVITHRLYQISPIATQA